MKYLKLFFIVSVLFVFLTPIQARKHSGFEIYGDIFQFLPIAAGVYSLTQKDYKGLGQLAIGAGSVLALTYAVKYSFLEISKIHPDWAKISQRPNHGSYDGFPSGHTASAFSAAGFMQRRYGWKWGVPTTVLATLVGISRIVAKRHTATQVVVGALIGYGLSYLVTSRFSKNFNLNVDFGTDEVYNGIYQNTYTITAHYRF